MSNSGHPHAVDRGLPGHGLGPARWLASEWGLALLALVLAVLVWAVVWGKISKPREIDLVDGLEIRVPKGFVAFHEGTVRLKLNGPRSELEEAAQQIGRRLVVHLEDLPHAAEVERIPLDDVDQFAFPFPSRLVESVTVEPPEVEVFAWTESQVRFVRPKVRGVPLGVGYEVEIDPPSAPVAGPAGKVGDGIQADPLELDELFAEGGTGFLPSDTRRPLTFNAWRKEPGERRYRADVELPPVAANVRFFFEGKRSISNRIEFKHPEGYVVTVSDPDVQLGNYTGRFRGVEEDLTRLEKSLDSWWYVVRVPADKLPADDNEVTEDLRIEFVHTQSLHDLRVEFLEGATQLVVIKRAP